MTESGPLLDAVVRAVAARSPLAGSRVAQITVGERLVLVELAVADSGGDSDAGLAGTDGADGAIAAGVTHRPPGDIVGDVAGRRARDIAQWAVDAKVRGVEGAGSVQGDVGSGDDRGDVLRRAVGVATLNALSAPLVAWQTGDPFEALAEDVSTIATVGLFGPAFRKFGAVEVRVIERRDVEPPETPDGVSVSVFDPSEADLAIDGADVVFVTGSSLLYGGTERYLEAARAVVDVVVVGATASFVPEPAFEAGATMLAGARVTDVAAVRSRIRAGECATDLHDEGLEKVYVTAEESPSGLHLG